MKKTLHLTLLLLFIMSNSLVQAQVRYQDEVFSEVTVTSNVTYGTNVSILPIILGESEDPAPEEMKMDIYEPTGDSLTNRPVVIITHRGDFLPAFVNQQPYGQKEDFAVAELCKSLARRGYVAIGMNHRVGWNPLGSSLEKKSTILQASYRAGQDLTTCVRYFRKSVAEDENPHGVDATKIAIGGYDSAGFAAHSAANLKTVDQTFLPKFLDLSTMPATPFVIPELYGNPQATDQGIINIPNYPDYSSEVSAVISMEGGLGDFNWIEAGDPPVIGFLHLEKFDEPGIRDVTEGTTSEILIPDGAFLDTIVHRNIELGNHDVFINANLDDPITQVANARSGGMEGLFLFNSPRIEGEVQCDPTPGVAANTWSRSIYPWNAYDEEFFAAVWNSIPDQPVDAAIQICNYNTGQGNPNDPAASLAYIDTMARYIAPRLVLAMGIGQTVSVDNTLKPTLNFEAYPNPATENILLKATETIKSVQLFDLNGRVIMDLNSLNHQQYNLNVSALPKGMYFAKIRFDKGLISEKIIVGN